jgi:capsular exopolysaccharide synthesis family protein
MRLLRKHARWLILATLAGLVGAWLIRADLPVQYTSTAQVDVESNAVAGAVPIEPNMATEKLVATSGIVLETTARALAAAPAALATELSALVSGTSNILSISCTMPTAAGAQHCAMAAAQAYVAFRNRAAGSAKDRAADPFQATVVTPALLPIAPAGTTKKILLPLGAILGLLLGVGGVFLRDYFDGRVRDRADLERCLDGQVLAAIPRVRGRRADPALVFSAAPSSRAAEAYRYLRARLDPLVTSTADRGAVLLVASAQARDGRTCVAANLAMALARTGASVILVDADLRHPALDEVFGVGDRPGLTDLLAGRASLDEAAVPTDVAGLRLVSAGELTDRRADLLEGTRLTQAFAQMRAAAQVTVVDSAPLLTVSDAITMAGVSDIVLVVADVRRTRRAAVSAAAQEIRASEPGTIVGILNGVSQPLAAGLARPGAGRAQESRAPAAVLPTLPGIPLAPGPNGLERASVSTARAAQNGTDTDTDVGDAPASAHDPG